MWIHGRVHIQSSYKHIVCKNGQTLQINISCFIHSLISPVNCLGQCQWQILAESESSHVESQSEKIAETGSDQPQNNFYRIGPDLSDSDIQ